MTQAPIRVDARSERCRADHHFSFVAPGDPVAGSRFGQPATQRRSEERPQRRWRDGSALVIPEARPLASLPLTVRPVRTHRVGMSSALATSQIRGMKMLPAGIASPAA